ncbi:hypothetical protein [Streptomyces zaomyceticus]|uniref:hypothetical protein n=1 Tax=Streptomyces zaomyceticus TaxID=68286 RepID=UPI00343325EF
MKLKSTPTTIHTADGSTVTVRPVGILFDLETKNAAGETIATVQMNQDDLDALYEEMGAHANSDSHDRAYRAGYSDGRGEWAA